MKTKFTLIILMISLLSFSQNGINYKALIKDDTGNVVSNDLIVVQFQILEGVGMSNVYQETHTPTTDANGIVVLTIGQGTTGDNFTDINWGTDDHFLNVQVNTGSGLTDMGTTQFMAVPYALNAANVSGLETLDEGNGIGWRLRGSEPENFGNIGLDAIDLTTSNFPNITNGATGYSSFAVMNGAIASGDYSISLGGIASGNNSIALIQATASGDNSRSLGIGSTASGDFSTAIGNATTALGQNSTAFGFFTNANGLYTSSLGIFTNADAYASTAIGSGNIGGGNPNAWVETDPLFEIGNNKDVPDTNLNQNALTVLKNGTITAPSLDIDEITDDKALVTREYYFSRLSNGSSGLERVNEGNGFGWKLKFQAASVHGDIGQSSIDLTTQASGFLGGATGDYATGIGFLSHAQGDLSTSLGWVNNSIGYASMALGDHTTTTAYGSTAVGTYNVGGGNPNSPVATDPLFEVGNGTLSEPSNAITVLKNGNVGLGSVTLPEAQLHLNGNIRIADAVVLGSSDSFRISGTTTDDLVGFYYSSSEWGPNANNISRLGSSAFRWSEIWSVNGLNTSSDRRLKKDIKPLNYGLETVLNLKPVSYKWKDGKQDTKLGFIAQDVEPIVPEIVKLNKTTPKERAQIKASGRKAPAEDMYGMSYIELIPVLVKAIQELKQENEELKHRIKKIENKSTN